jgi:XTP/dITP diphosphohydrolase
LQLKSEISKLGSNIRKNQQGHFLQRTSYPPIPTRAITRFLRIVRRLRAECPWDREQTHRSIRHSLIEETYEVIEALDANDLAALKNELGDLLLHIAMHATIAEQAAEFTLKDIVTAITEKLIRRHPHVFGGVTAGSSHEVKQNWERLKMREGRSSLLDGVPKGLPALQRALRVQERAAKVGFDWKREADVWAKVREEGEELKRAIKRKNSRKREEEFGDYLFSLVNYARFIGVEPESALRGTVEKFTRRFQYIERELQRRKKDIHSSTLEEMDALWNKAKKKR